MWADAILGLARCALLRTDDVPNDFRLHPIGIIETEVDVNRGWNDPGDVEARRFEEFELLMILEGEAAHPDRYIGEAPPVVLVEHIDGDTRNNEPANPLRITDADTLREHGGAIFGDGGA